MEYAAAARQAAAAPPPADPHHSHPYAAYPYPYGAYYQPAPVTDSSLTATGSYYYPAPAPEAAPAPAPAAAVYDPYAAYQYYASPAGAAVVGREVGLTGYYFTAGQASQQAATPSAPQATSAATAVTAKETGKNFGFDAKRYVQAAAARAPNGMTQPVAAPGMHHAQWNASFGHPLPKYALKKHIKKMTKFVQPKVPKVVQPVPCEVCNIQCDTQEVLMVHKQGKKHKKNMEKLQDSITRKPTKPPVQATGPNETPAAVATCQPAAAQPKKKKSSSAATPEELEVKKRRVLEAGAAQGEVKICTVCNVVVNSQKVYDFHIAGQKHQTMVQKQRAIQFVAA